MSKGNYPKLDGQILFDKDVNMSYYQATLSTNADFDAENITDTATMIVDFNTTRKRILIRNIGNEVVYIGNASVNTDSIALYPMMNILLFDKDSIYGVTSSGTSEVRFIEVK